MTHNLYLNDVYVWALVFRLASHYTSSEAIEPMELGLPCCLHAGHGLPNAAINASQGWLGGLATTSLRPGATNRTAPFRLSTYLRHGMNRTRGSYSIRRAWACQKCRRRGIGWIGAATPSHFYLDSLNKTDLLSRSVDANCSNTDCIATCGCR